MSDRISPLNTFSKIGIAVLAIACFMPPEIGIAASMGRVVGALILGAFVTLVVSLIDLMIKRRFHFNPNILIIGAVICWLMADGTLSTIENSYESKSINLDRATIPMMVKYCNIHKGEYVDMTTKHGTEQWYITKDGKYMQMVRSGLLLEVSKMDQVSSERQREIAMEDFKVSLKR
ncbi:MAG: hypothetical protein KDC80_21525 [Saprospiraceae bacterium]|nr:hypothetical protein [Saprospiraceae bacterium]